MKNLFLFCCLLFALKSSFAQDTLYYYENGCLAPTAEGASTIAVVLKNNPNDAAATVIEYYKSGLKKSEIYYSNYEWKYLDKQYNQWYENGQIKIQANYENRLLDGAVRTYWEDGTKKREDVYSKNVLINGKCWDKEGNEIPHFDYQTKAQLTFNVNEHVKKNIKYPKKAIDTKKAERIITQFTISKDGNVCNIRTLGNPNKHLASECIRVIKLMPNCIPATLDGENVASKFVYPINFTLSN